MDTPLSSLTQLALSAAEKAGHTIMDVYNGAIDCSLQTKADNSPLTTADLLANELITQTLATSFPILSEEGKTRPYENRNTWETFWCVDPLDGTKEFIKRNGEFTVNIALISRGIPVIGVIYSPVGNIMYYATQGEGACRSVVRRAKRYSEPLPCVTTKRTSVAVSRSHFSERLERYLLHLEQRAGHPIDLVRRGSALKLALVAEGAATFYPRLDPTMEWDTAAGDAILRELGGGVYEAVTQRNGMVTPGSLLQYNKPDLHNPDFIAALDIQAV